MLGWIERAINQIYGEDGDAWEKFIADIRQWWSEQRIIGNDFIQQIATIGGFSLLAVIAILWIREIPFIQKILRSGPVFPETMPLSEDIRSSVKQILLDKARGFRNQLEMNNAQRENLLNKIAESESLLKGFFKKQSVASDFELRWERHGQIEHESIKVPELNKCAADCADYLERLTVRRKDLIYNLDEHKISEIQDAAKQCSKPTKIVLRSQQGDSQQEGSPVSFLDETESGEFDSHYRVKILNQKKEKQEVGVRLELANPAIDHLPVPLTFTHFKKKKMIELSPGIPQSVDVFQVIVADEKKKGHNRAANPEDQNKRLRILDAEQSLRETPYQKYHLKLCVHGSGMTPVTENFIFQPNNDGTAILFKERKSQQKLIHILKSDEFDSGTNYQRILVKNDSDNRAMVSARITQIEPHPNHIRFPFPLEPMNHPNNTKVEVAAKGGIQPFDVFQYDPSNKDAGVTFRGANGLAGSMERQKCRITIIADGDTGPPDEKHFEFSPRDDGMIDFNVIDP